MKLAGSKRPQIPLNALSALRWPAIALLASLLLIHVFVAGARLGNANFGKYLSGGREYRNGQLNPERVTDFSPFYFDLEMALSAVSDPHNRLPVFLQILAGVFVVLVFFFLAAGRLSPWASFFAALGLSLSPGILIFSRVLVPDIWYTLFFLLGLLFFERHILRQQMSMTTVVLSGVFFGLAMFVRPTALLIVPFLFIACYVSGKANRARTAGVLSLILLLSACSLLLRNFLYTGSPVFLSLMDSGGVFYEGNNPYSDGNGVNTPLVKDLEGEHLEEPSYAQVLIKRIPSAEAGHKLDAGKANTYWRNKALRFIADHPASYLRLLGKKVRLLFQSADVHDVSAAQVVERRLREVHFPFAPVSFVSALCVLGLYLRRKEWRALFLFYAAFWLGVAVPLVFFVSSRYRLPMLPFLFFFAAAAVEQLARLPKRGSTAGILAALAFVLLLALPLQLYDGEARAHRYVWDSVIRAHSLQSGAADLRNSGQRLAAAKDIARALAAAPFLSDVLILANLPYSRIDVWAQAVRMRLNVCETSSGDPSCFFDLGLLCLESGRIQQARKAFGLVAGTEQSYPRWYRCSAEPEYYLGQIACCDEGNWDDGILHFRRALSRNPGDPSTLAGMTVAMERIGRKQESERYRTMLYRYFDEPDAVFFLGRMYWCSKDYERSAQQFGQVVRWLPDYRKARIYYAAALSRSQHYDQAVAEYARAAWKKQDPLLLEEPILEAFRQYSRTQNSARAFCMLGLTYRQYGRFDEAYQALSEALNKDPDYKPAGEEIRKLEALNY